MRCVFLLLCLVPFCAHAACQGQSPAWVTLEIVAGEVAGDEPAEFVDITQAGCVTTRYASFDTRAGVYQYELDAGEKAGLSRAIAGAQIADFNAAAVRDKIKVKEAAAAAGNSQKTLWGAFGGDSYRLQVDDGGKHNVISWYAPKQEAEHRNDVTELATLVDFIQSVQRIGASERKTKVAEVGK